MSCHDYFDHYYVEIIVSIPIGFSNELQLRLYVLRALIQTMFQSLSGFPMSCVLAHGKTDPLLPKRLTIN